jgi:hypothetical protein
MARKSAAARSIEENQDALPSTLMPPTKVPAQQQEAYWLELANNPEQFAAAVQTEDDFFKLIRTIPSSLWGDKLRLYLYRKPSDDGLMIKNPADSPYSYAQVVFKAVDEQWVADNWGGGKYQLWLKYGDKEKKIDETIKKHTFTIDGPPKVKSGQTVILDGKTVAIGEAAPAAAAENKTDIASVIDAQTRATEATMSMMSHAAERSIDMVAAHAAKPAAEPSPLTTLEGIAQMVKLFQPPPAADPIETFIKLQTLMGKQNPEPALERETPIEETLGAIEKLTGGRSLIELLKPAAKAAAEESPWTPFVSVAQTFVQSLPALMGEFRHNRDMEFRRQVWLRTAQAGAEPPKELLAANPAPPAAPAAPAQPGIAAVPAPAPGRPDIGQLTNALVQAICRGFDRNPLMGEQTAGMIDVLYGEQIESLGLEKYLADETQLTQYIQGVPPLAQRATDARWARFQDDFLRYTEARWAPPEDEDDDDELAKVPGPQPVA